MQIVRGLQALQALSIGSGLAIALLFSGTYNLTLNETGYQRYTHVFQAVSIKLEREDPVIFDSFSQ
ncbi:MAG: hypothetical protein AAFY11_04625 [Cyanobacteria bacterium J06641_5]